MDINPIAVKKKCTSDGNNTITDTHTPAMITLLITGNICI